MFYFQNVFILNCVKYNQNKWPLMSPMPGAGTGWR